MKQTKMLIYVDSKNNNNKFYKLSLNEDNSISIEYGRVGANPRKLIKQGGEKVYKTLLNSKLRDGYVESEIITETSKLNNDKTNLLELAMSQIKHSDKKSKELIKRLVDANIHSIESNTNISFDKNINGFTTPLGPVTLSGILKAKDILNEIQENLNKNSNTLNRDFIRLNEKYFEIIPTKIKNLREQASYMLINEELIDNQKDICNTLEKTLSMLSKPKKTQTETEEIFKVDISYLDDKKEFKRINDFFESSKKSMHGRDINNSKIVNIFSVSIGDEDKLFRKDLDNKMELFHGTKIVNLLSILKSGLLMPKETPGQKCGAAYGDGLYFASNSSKSQQYCSNSGYRGSFQKDNLIYMLIADVAMGNYEIPSSWKSKKPSKGFDSFWAKANKSGVINDEMIVFNKNQIKIKYILEIKI